MLLSYNRLLRVWAAALIGALALTLLLPAPDARAAGDGLAHEEVSFRGGGGLLLHGTILSKGGDRTRSPGVVLVGGSGPGPREEYRQEAEAFARAGITTLVFDKRTVRYSTFHRDFGLLAEDALAGVRLLRGRPDVDPRHVGLRGFSEGGWVAPLAAARSSDVAFVVTIGASGYSPLRTEAWNLTTHLRHRNVTGSFEHTVSGPAARLTGATGLFSAADYDPVPVLQRLHRTPVLALWGEYDTQVPPRESAGVFRRALARAGNAHAVIRFVTGGAHNGHRTSDGFDRIGGPLFHGKPLGELAPACTRTVTTWIRAVGAGHPPVSDADPAPPQAASSTPVSDPGPYAWLSPALLLLGFAAYPVGAVVRRAPVVRPVRRTAGLGLVTVTAALVCPLSVFAVGDAAATPVIWGRPAGWLVAQALGVTMVAVTCAAAAALWRSRGALGRTAWLRSAPVALAAVGFVPWALWWGVLRP
ncbi:alpha/beta hydrolase family protein [Streptomyces sp. NPDC002004]